MLLSIEQVSVAYNELQVLNDVNLQIQDNEFIAITGDNGSGKTTLLKTLLGLKQPSDGKIVKAEDLNMGYVPQITQFDKEFPITVKNVILTGSLDKKVRVFKRYSKKDVSKTKELMARFGLEDLSKRSLSTLSGGQLQKVLICRALISDPDLIILDEPTASIDDSTTDEIFKLLKGISKSIPVVIVTHDQKRVTAFADTVYCVEHKQLSKVM